MRAVLAVALMTTTAPALADPIPDSIAAMIEAAKNDPAKLAVIADIAKQTNPASAAEIDARVATINADAAKAREEALASQGFLQGWTGSGEAGAFLSSGNTNTRGVAIGVNVSKETRLWKHALRGFADYQRQDGVTTRERYLAGYQGNYNISDRLFALLALSYEKDAFSGFNSRFSQSLGLGYKVLSGPAIFLTVEGGPALRQTSFTDGTTDKTFAARVAGDFKWQISPALSFTQGASYFYDNSNNSFQSLTSLNAKINSALSARLSYQLNTESNPPLGRRKSDKVSRMTVVYAF